MSLDPKSGLSIGRVNITSQEGYSAVSRWGSIVSVDIGDEKVFSNVCFSWSKRFNIGSSATVDIVINPQNIDTDKYLIVFPATFSAFGAGPIFIDMYFATTYTGGTKWEGSNRLNTSNTIPKTEIYLSPTIISPGIKLPPEFMISSNSGGPAGLVKVGGQTKDSLIFVGRKDGNYMFRCINQESAVAKCSFAITIFEIAEGE